MVLLRSLLWLVAAVGTLGPDPATASCREADLRLLGTLPLQPAMLDDPLVRSLPPESMPHVAYVVRGHRSCEGQISDAAAVDVAGSVLGSIAGEAHHQIAQEVISDGSWVRSFGAMDVYCAAGSKVPTDDVVVIRRTPWTGAASIGHYCQPFIVGRGAGAEVRAARQGASRWELGWIEADFHSQFLGFLQEDGRSWAFAYRTGGVVVVDLAGEVVLDGRSWSRGAHLVQDDGAVVLLALLIEGREGHRVEEHGYDTHRAALLRIDANGTTVLAASPYGRPDGPGANWRHHEYSESFNTLIRPIEEHARSLFEELRRQGRIRDQE